MRKVFLSILTAIIAIAAMAQSNEPYMAFVELKGYQKGLFSTKVTVTVDFGQEVSFLKQSKDTKLVDEQGNDIVFNSMVDAMNFMSKRGWDFAQAYVVTDGGQNVYHWLLKKEVTDDSQITTGLNLKADFSKSQSKYTITYMKRPANRPEWDIVKVEKKDALSEEDITTIISEWKSQSNERYIYECKIKKE